MGRCVFCQSLGAEAIDRSARNFVDEVLELTIGRGVDVVVDCAGAENLNANLQAVAIGGRIVLLATLQPNATIELQTVIDKQLVICGGSNRAREPSFRRYLAAQLREHVWPLLEGGAIKPTLHHVTRIAHVMARPTRGPPTPFLRCLHSFLTQCRMCSYLPPSIWCAREV
jgi:NADPH2:quinone reductase